MSSKIIESLSILHFNLITAANLFEETEKKEKKRNNNKASFLIININYSYSCYYKIIS